MQHERKAAMTLSATPEKRQCKYQLTVKNLNNLPHIAAHLQAAQSQRTDPSLQKSCNLANAPNSTHHPDRKTLLKILVE